MFRRYARLRCSTKSIHWPCSNCSELHRCPAESVHRSAWISSTSWRSSTALPRWRKPCWRLCSGGWSTRLASSATLATRNKDHSTTRWTSSHAPADRSSSARELGFQTVVGHFSRTETDFGRAPVPTDQQFVQGRACWQGMEMFR